jgi:hypothetical protein
MLINNKMNNYCSKTIAMLSPYEKREGFNICIIQPAAINLELNFWAEYKPVTCRCFMLK